MQLKFPGRKRRLHEARLVSTGVELPASYSKSPLVVYFTYNNVYISMLLS